MGIFLDCIVFFAGSFLEGSLALAEGCAAVSAPDGLDFVDLAAADALEDSLSLAVLGFVWASGATFWAFFPAPCGAPSFAASPPTSSALPLASPAPVLPSVDLRVSLGLRAVLKKDKPFSSALLLR